MSEDPTYGGPVRDEPEDSLLEAPDAQTAMDARNVPMKDRWGILNLKGILEVPSELLGSTLRGDGLCFLPGGDGIVLPCKWGLSAEGLNRKL